MEIADGPEFFFDVAGFDFFRECAEVFALVSPVFNASKIVSAASMPDLIAM